MKHTSTLIAFIALLPTILPLRCAQAGDRETYDTKSPAGVISAEAAGTAAGAAATYLLWKNSQREPAYVTRQLQEARAELARIRQEEADFLKTRQPPQELLSGITEQEARLRMSIVEKTERWYAREIAEGVALEAAGKTENLPPEYLWVKEERAALKAAIAKGLRQPRKAAKAVVKSQEARLKDIRGQLGPAEAKIAELEKTGSLFRTVKHGLTVLGGGLTGIGTVVTGYDFYQLLSPAQQEASLEAMSAAVASQRAGKSEMPAAKSGQPAAASPQENAAAAAH